MNYSDVLYRLKNSTNNKIIVTGPQRSGTTITAKIIAYDLGFRFIPEEEFSTINQYKYVMMINNHDKFVMQAPAMSSICHYFPTIIVFMRRSIQEIIKSQNRISWNHEEKEKIKYFNESEDPIAKVKYDVWDKYQKPNVKEYFDLDYDSLKDHPLWIKKEERSNFRPRQTYSPNGDAGPKII